LERGNQLLLLLPLGLYLWILAIERDTYMYPHGISMTSAAVNAKATTWTHECTQNKRTTRHNTASIAKIENETFYIAIDVDSDLAHATAHHTRLSFNHSTIKHFPISIGRLLSNQNVGCKTWQVESRVVVFTKRLAHKQYRCVYHLPHAAKSDQGSMGHRRAVEWRWNETCRHLRLANLR
jgi:hypothetical protein